MGMASNVKITHVEAGGSSTVEMDSLWVSTTKKRHNQIVDNIFRDRPVLAYMRERKNTDFLSDGGDMFIIPLELAENPNVEWIGKDQGLSMDDFDPLTAAQYTPKDIAANVKFSRHEMRVNAGSQRVFSLIDTKIKNTEKTMKKLMSQGVCTGAGGNTLEIDGLTRLIEAAVPASQTLVIGRVDPATVADWRTFGVNMSGEVAGSVLEEFMLDMYKDIVDEVGPPHVIFADQDTENTYELSARDYITSGGRVKIADFTFDMCMFIPSGELRFCHSEFFYFCVDSRYDYAWTDWKEQVNVPFTRHKQLLTTCATARSAGRGFGCLFNISATG
jgi:hypothetical protein